MRRQPRLRHLRYRVVEQAKAGVADGPKQERLRGKTLMDQRNRIYVELLSSVVPTREAMRLSVITGNQRLVWDHSAANAGAAMKLAGCGDTGGGSQTPSSM